MLESKLQQEIIIFFRNEYQRHGKGVIFSVPNESTYENKKFKNTGVLSGVSDLVVLLDRKTIFVELKTSTTQKEAQIKFQSIVENLGFDYYIIRSLDNFKEMLNKHV